MATRKPRLLVDAQRLFAARSYDDAYSATEQLLAAGHDTVEVRVLRSRILSLTEQVQAAKTEATLALAFDPTNVAHVFRRAMCALEAEDNALAFDDLSAILEYPDAEVRAYFRNSALLYRSVASLKLGNFESALEDALAASDDPFLQVFVGRIVYDRETMLRSARQRGCGA
jgi:hypothetical protein